MVVAFSNGQEISIDNILIPVWDIDEMESIEVIQVTGTTLRLRAFTDAYYYDEFFEDVDGLYEDTGVNNLVIKELVCKFDFQVDFNIRDLSQGGSVKSLDFAILNISDINYQLAGGYVNRAINRTVLDRAIYKMLKESVGDSFYGIRRNGFTLEYSLS